MMGTEESFYGDNSVRVHCIFSLVQEQKINGSKVISVIIFMLSRTPVSIECRQ